MSETAPAPTTVLGSSAAAAPATPAPAAAAPAATAPAPAAPTDTRAWLPEGYRTDPTFKDIGDIEVLAKSYKNAASLIGADKATVLRIPTDPASADMGEIYNRLGRPESPEKYSAWEGAPIGEAAVPELRAKFHEAGLSDAQAKAVVGLYAEQTQAAVVQRQAQDTQVAEATIADLKREWGDAFGDRLLRAERALLDTGGEDLLALFQQARGPDGAPLASNAAMIRALAKMGERIAEPSTLRGTNGNSGAGPRTPADAQAEIAKLTGDRAFYDVLKDRFHPEYPAKKQLWDTLHQQAFPSAA